VKGRAGELNPSSSQDEHKGRLVFWDARLPLMIHLRLIEKGLAVCTELVSHMKINEIGYLSDVRQNGTLRMSVLDLSSLPSCVVFSTRS
jgi:hypothetical protein